MNNQIVSNHFPYLPLHLKLKFDRSHEINQDTEALVDTGFSGDVTIPPSWITNGHRPDGYAAWAMADGSATMAPIYVGSIRIDGFEKTFSVTITVLGDEVMIGRGIIDRFKLTLDHGKKLIIEP